MDLHRATVSLMFIFSLLSLHYKVIYGDASVLLLDSPTRRYFRHTSDQSVSLSLAEIGATASVLLGFAPSSELTSASSSKLNEVLVPNPFDKPWALLMVEITGAEESQLIADSDKTASSNVLRIKVEDNKRVDIQLPDEEVSMISLNGESSTVAECSDKDLRDFATWLGGSYVEDASQKLNGELVIPMADGHFLTLHLSERADREFSTSLVLIINNIRSAVEIHQVLTKSERSPAELIIGRFDGIKALKDHYGNEGITQSGLQVFVSSISKLFDSMLAAYQGQVVGVIANGGKVDSESKNMFHVTLTSRPYARRLEEVEATPQEIIIAETIFVRKTLAWTTGIILLVSTILGIHFLVNMPITKDTLLYSNVKLD